MHSGNVTGLSKLLYVGPGIPDSTGVGDRLRWASHYLSILTKSLMPTQSLILSGKGNEYQPQ